MFNEKGFTKFDCYLGNPAVKRDGVIQAYTNYEIAEYAKCSADPVYFCKKYLKVIHLDRGLVDFELYPYQEDMFKHFIDNRFSIVLACRQSGKSVSSVAYILWYAIFKPDKKVGILANKGGTAREMLARITLMLENLPFFLQPGCKILNKGNVLFSNNSEIRAESTSSNSIRGFSMNLLYLDEFAFVNDAATFYTSTYPVITSGETTQVIITSTANGIGNQYHKIWEGAMQGTNDFKHFRVDWWDVPGRDKKWKETTVNNTSQLQFDQEFGNCLRNSSRITICMNNHVAEMVAEIAIGDLYECISRGSTSGLPIDEEIRLKAIHWYHDRKTYLEQKNYLMHIDDLQILTPSGFQKFDGIARYYHDHFLRIWFDDSYIDVAKNHRFIINGDKVYAKDIQVNDNVGKIVSSIETIEESDWFYDPINVDDGSVFYHDDKILSSNTFFGTGDTLIDAETLMALRAKVPLYVQGDATVYEEAIPGHEYVMTVDVSKGRSQDFSTFNVIDITSSPFKQVAVYRNNKISPLLFPDIIEKYAKAYNEAYVIVESNDQGTVVCNGLYHDLEYENMHVESAVKNKLGMEITRKSKRIGCTGFKDILESGKLEIVDELTIKEISTFESKGVSFEASSGNHDDLVMNLVLFGYFTGTRFFSDMTNINMREMLYDQRMKEIEADVLPFGIINDGFEDIHDEEDMLPSPQWSLVEFDGPGSGTWGDY